MPDAPWLSPNVGVDVVAPKQSAVGSRAPLEYRDVVEQFEVQTCVRYKKRDIDGKPGDETCCNFFVHDVLQAVGVQIPRMRANDHQMWLENAQARASGWYKCPEWAARMLASLVGCPVVALWSNPNGLHGHVAMVVPARTELDKETTFIAQAGAVNFPYGRLVDGFGARPVVFYAHP